MAICQLEPSSADEPSAVNRPSGQVSGARAVWIAERVLTLWVVALCAAIVVASLTVVALAAAAGPALCLILFRRNTRLVTTAAMHRLIWQRMLRGGTSPARIMAVAAIAISLFAMLYWAMCTSGAGVGDIMLRAPQGGHASVTVDILELPGVGGEIEYRPIPSSPSLVVRRCVYFSVATITTLGYGDYFPTGRAQWLAMLEAICGVLLMVTLTASLVRRMMMEPAHAA